VNSISLAENVCYADEPVGTGGGPDTGVRKIAVLACSVAKNR
jgi:hypothetical protein